MLIMPIQIVPRESAVFGLSGMNETPIKLDADHGNMCRFDLSIERDRDNYELVRGNLSSLCQKAVTDAVARTEEKGEQLNFQKQAFSVLSLANRFLKTENGFDIIDLEDHV